MKRLAAVAVMLTLAAGCQSPLQTAAADGAFDWKTVPGWAADAHHLALAAFVRGCEKIKQQARWQALCAQAAATPDANAREFFEQHFAPRCFAAADDAPALITGYYEPLLRGSRTRSARFPHPVYARPADTALAQFSRAEIDGAHQPLAGRELLWVADAIDLFFLHIQGSGIVELDDSTRVAVRYAADNGHAYHSIGKAMADQNIMPLEDINLFSIRRWLRDNPQRMQEIFNLNPRYIFFSEAVAGADGPIGALGVALTPMRSIAVDKKHIPLGAPVWLDTTFPDDAKKPLRRLMVAQDTGAAIRGAHRADVFWGRGNNAEKMAGLMKSRGRMCVLEPR